MAWATLGGRSAHWEAPPAPTTASKSRYGNDTSSRPPALSLDVVGTHTEHKLHLLADISSSPHDAFCRRRARRRTRRTGDAGAVARRPALDGPPTTVAAPASRDEGHFWLPLRVKVAGRLKVAWLGYTPPNTHHLTQTTALDYPTSSCTSSTTSPRAMRHDRLGVCELRAIVPLPFN